MSASELKTVPVEPTEEMLEAGEETFTPSYSGTPASSPGRVWAAMLAASPSQPVAGAEAHGWLALSDAARSGERILLLWRPFGGMKEHVELGWWSKSKAAWTNTYGHPFGSEPDAWAPLAPFASPPPPADLKAEAETLASTYVPMAEHDLDRTIAGLGRAITSFGERIRSAAHAAGKAEGEAEIERWADDARRMSGCLIAIRQAPDYATIAALKSVAYDAALNCIKPDVAEYQIERRSKAERDQNPDPVATARAEALEEAARLIEANNIVHTSEGDVLSPRRHGNSNGLVFATAIRALSTQPPAPREESR